MLCRFGCEKQTMWTIRDLIGLHQRFNIYMKRVATLFGIGLAAFVGVLGALKLDRSMARNEAVQAWEAPFTGRTASLENTAEPVDFRPAVRKLLPSVVSVDKSERVYRSYWARQAELTETGTGSGVIISKDGYILTNNHVVQGADVVRVRLSDQKSYSAKIIGTDPRSDLAVLKVEAPGLVPAELGDSSKLEVGEWVIAVGNPLGFSNTVSVGVVSSLNRTLPTNESLLVDAIQTDAAINQGNSGGALTNALGQVVGINSAIASNSGGSIGLGFSIPINRAKKVVSDILKYGRVKYGWLGVNFYEGRVSLKDPYVQSQIASEVGATPPSQGLIVSRVNPASGASKAGLKPFDIIQKADGVVLNEGLDFNRLMVDKKPGDQLKLVVWSAGTTKTITVTLEDLTGL